MKKGILTILLLLVAVAGGLGMITFQRQYSGQIQWYQDQVDAAQADLDAAVAESQGILPSNTAEAEAKRIEQERLLLEQAQGEADSLTAEGRDLDSAISAALEELSAAQTGEEYEYYKAAYDSYAEGRAQVERYLEDN